MWLLLYVPAALQLSDKAVKRIKRKNSAHHYSSAAVLSTDDPLKFCFSVAANKQDSVKG